MPRKAKSNEVILKIIKDEKRPLSSLDIQNKCSNLDRATVYRTLNSLKEKQKVRVVEIGDGTIRFESVDDHHHHLICLICKEIEKVDLPAEEENHLQKVQENFEKQSKFISLQHSLEFFGLCQKCQNAKIALK